MKQQKKKLLDMVRDKVRSKHYSLSTEVEGSGDNDNLINLAPLLKVLGISQQAVLGAVKRE